MIKIFFFIKKEIYIYNNCKYFINLSVSRHKIKINWYKIKRSKIDLDLERNENWCNYRSSIMIINSLKYYMIYFNLKIQNEGFSYRRLL